MVRVLIALIGIVELRALFDQVKMLAYLGRMKGMLSLNLNLEIDGGQLVEMGCGLASDHKGKNRQKVSPAPAAPNTTAESNRAKFP